MNVPRSRRLFAQAIAAAPNSATPLEAIGAGLAAFATDFGEDDRRDFLAKRQAIIAGNPDLQERELSKSAALTAAMAEALAERGVKQLTAGIVAQVGALALSTAYLRWLEPANRQTLTKLAKQAPRELSAATELLR